MAASTHAVGRATSAFEPLNHASGGNLVCQTARYSLTAAASANDVFQMIKVPNGATIVNMMFEGNGSPFTYTVGDGGSAARFIAASSISAAVTRGAIVKDVLPFRVSVTANAPDKWDTIDVKLTAVTATVALNFSLTVFYLVDGQDRQ